MAQEHAVDCFGLGDCQFAVAMAARSQLKLLAWRAGLFELYSRSRVHPTSSISGLLSVFDLGRLLVQPGCCVGGFDAHVFPHFLPCRVHHEDPSKGPAAFEARLRDDELLGSGKKDQSARSIILTEKIRARPLGKT